MVTESGERISRWFVLFADGAVEPVVERPWGADMVEATVHGRRIRRRIGRVADGVVEAFGGLLPLGARALLDATVPRERAFLATLGALPKPLARTPALALTRPLASIDVEATGPDPAHDHVVEAAVVKLHPDGSRTRAVWRINPGVPIPAETTAIHDITDDDVRLCDHFPLLAQAIAAELEGCDLLGYGVRMFDDRILRAEFARARVPWPCEGAHIVDAMPIFKTRERRDLSTAVRWYLGREHKGAHGALADAEETLDVFLAQLARYPDLPRDVAGLDKASGGRLDHWASECGSLEWDAGGDAVIAFGGRNRGLRLIDAETSLLYWILGKDFPSDEAKALCRAVLAGERPRAPGAAPAPATPRRIRRGHAEHDREEDGGEEEQSPEDGADGEAQQDGVADDGIPSHYGPQAVQDHCDDDIPF